MHQADAPRFAFERLGRARLREAPLQLALLAL
jgi:hypothetical protein